MAGVVFDGVTKVFRDGTRAVSSLDLEIPDSCLFVVVGPSGCGKTTLLRLAAGLEEPTEGRILLGGKDVTEDAPRDRDVAMVFQNYALYPHMTVFENIAFGLRSRRIPRQEVDRLVSRAASLLGLEGLLRKRPRSLSGGQRQRVALGRAIVREPQVFLMDEPLSDLDAGLRDKMRTEVARIQRTLGVTTLYVTHDQGEALTLGSLVAVMEEGVVRQVGTPQEIYEAPADLFVAGFVGTPAMNLAEATIERDAGGWEVRLGSHRLALDAGWLEDREIARYEGRQVVLGIRPEHVRLSGGPSRRGEGVLSVTVERRELLGAEVLLRFRVDAPLLMTRDPRDLDRGEGDPWAVERPNTFVARVRDEDAPAERSPVDIAIDMTRIHLFDPGTTLAIG
jgi:multiple sugar transport system ATP-binding protein